MAQLAPMKQDVKRTREWGESMGRGLWKTYKRFDIPWKGAKTLDFGCHWGYLCVLQRQEAGVAEAHGVDIIDTWNQMVDGYKPHEEPGVRLFKGDALTLPELQDQTYDVVTTSGTLMILEQDYCEAVITWLYDRLRPGGHAILQTRTYLSPYGADLHRTLDTPYPHVLFSQRVLDRYMLEKHGREVRPMLPYCGATWIMLFRSLGFDIVEVEGYTSTPVPAELRARHPSRFAPFDRREQDCGILTVHARKPETVDLSDLERA